MSAYEAGAPDLDLAGSAGRDPIDKTTVEAFSTKYPDETDAQLHARIERAWSSTGTAAELPMTVDAVTRWRGAQ